MSETIATPQISEAKLAANRANAQKSPGPTSSAGKAKSSANALKTALTGRTVILPSDDLAAYQHHLNRIIKRYTPTDEDEHSFVQSIADAEWRLIRIASLEEGIYAHGHDEVAEQFAHEPDPAVRQSLIRNAVFNLNRKELSNLALQERRIRNQRKDDIAELKELRAERREKEEAAAKDLNAQLNSMLAAVRSSKNAGIPFDPASLRFDFSNQEAQTYNQLLITRNKLGIQTRVAHFADWLKSHRAESTQKAAA